MASSTKFKCETLTPDDDDMTDNMFDYMGTPEDLPSSHRAVTAEDNEYVDPEKEMLKKSSKKRKQGAY